MAERSAKILIEVLRSEFGCSNNNQLAKKLGVSLPQILSWQDRKLSRTTLRNMLRKLETRIVKNSFARIFEFRKLDRNHEMKADSLRSRIGNKAICEDLANSKGIYAFYNSSGKLIYVGKTEKNTLLHEMGQQFSKRKVAIKKTNKRGRFVTVHTPLKEFVEYCSAYRIHSNVIANFEAFIMRMVPNDVMNSQIPKYKL